jgi:hypothetical protein
VGQNLLDSLIIYYENTESRNDMKPRTRYEETLQVSWRTSVPLISREKAAFCIVILLHYSCQVGLAHSVHNIHETKIHPMSKFRAFKET